MRKKQAGKRKRVTYRVRAGSGKRYVTNPDGTVDAISTTASGHQIVARLREPFASVVASPFDPKRVADAIAGLDVYNPDARSLMVRLERERKIGKTPN